MKYLAFTSFALISVCIKFFPWKPFLYILHSVRDHVTVIAAYFAFIQKKKKNQIYLFRDRSAGFCSAKLFLNELSSVPDRSPPLWNCWLALGFKCRSKTENIFPLHCLTTTDVHEPVKASWVGTLQLQKCCLASSKTPLRSLLNLHLQ